MSTAKTVVILGAGFAGMPLAHKLLKHTLPKTKGALKVILVSPNTHFYWNLAAVRAVIPGTVPEEKLFLPIEPGFAQYSSKDFEFVLGKADSIDLEKNVVEIANNDGSQQSLAYDQLVIATGSKLRSGLPFKPIGTHEETLAALHALQKQIDAAKSIIVAGAGPTGVETVGELADAYAGKKEITMIIGAERPLQASGVLPSVSQVVEKSLQKLGVKLVRNVQVTKAETNEPGTQTVLTLSNGTSLSADLYLPLYGVQVNTSFIPESLLDSTGNLVLDKMLRVQGTKNVWGIGDVGNLEVKQLTVIDAQVIHVSAALDATLTGATGKVKEFKPVDKITIAVTIGKKYATGQVGGLKLWGKIVLYLKAKTLFLDKAPPYVGGKQLMNGKM